MKTLIRKKSARMQNMWTLCLLALCLLAVKTSAAELLANRSFDMVGGAGWMFVTNTQFSSSGEAYLHPTPGYMGTVLWQNLDVANVSSATGTASLALRKTGTPPSTNTLAVYLDYTIASGATNRLLLLSPANDDVGDASTPFSTNFTLPTEARRIVRLAVEKNSFGNFYAQEISLDMVSSSGKFFPGSGGSIPVIAPLTGITNQIGGLQVEQIDREGMFFGSGTRAILDLDFPAPATYGASGYLLQRSVDGSTGWEAQQWNSADLLTPTDTTDNFSFNPDGSYYYRLKVIGGPRADQFSNVIEVPYPIVDTYFAEWGIGTAFVGMTMPPWVGHGLEAHFTVKKLSDNSVVEGGLSYQWYRVNPLSSAMTAISGETNLTYTTTEDDLGGYHLLCKATGDEVSVGGFVQVKWGGPLMPNNSFASNVSRTGFRLNFYKSVSSLLPADLKLEYYDESFQSVVLPITSITPLTGNASFDIAVTIPASVSTLRLSAVSDVWGIVSEGMMPGHLMEGLQIDIPADPYTYTTNSDDTITITGYAGPGGAVNIPSTLSGKIVTRILNQAFRTSTNLTSVTIPSSVKYIGWGAFMECSGLTSVTISGGVTNIDAYAFQDCTKLTTVTVPGSLVYLGAQAFRNCTGLLGVYFSGNAPVLGDSAVFDNASSSTVYRLSGATGWPAVPGKWGDRPTALWNADTVKPTVTILAPVANSKVSNAVYAVRGTATDNKAVASVWVQVNSNDWTQADGTNSWTNTVTLIAGPNTIRAYSVDTTGNNSLTSSVICTYGVAGMLTITTNGAGTVARTPATAVEIGQTYTLAATPGAGYGFVNWSGDVTGTNKVVTVKATSNTTVVANFADNVKPTVTITAPTANLKVTNADCTVSGKATDNKAVVSVWVQVNSNDWIQANGTNSWSLLVTLAAGPNTIRAYSVDAANNCSAILSVFCTYGVSGRLTITTNGLGTVGRAPSTPVEIGQTYTLTATPGAGYGFVNWSGDVTGTNKVVTVKVTSNTTVVANFADNVKPTVTIKLPTTALKVSNAVYAVRGTATDNKAVASVWVQVNTNDWTQATGTNSWTNTVTLTAGPNTIRAYSMDAANNCSATSSVICTYGVSGRLTITTNGLGTVARSPTTAVELGQTYTLTATPGVGYGFVNWSGDVTGTSKVVTVKATSNTTVVANFADNVKPTVTITAPVANSKVSNAVYAVRGTATDNKAVASVWVQVNSNDWTQAIGTNSWTNTVTLTAGPNTIRAYSVDTTGNNSLTSSVICTYGVSGRLTITTNGLGTVARTPATAVEIGQTYTLTATPGAGYGFVNWSGDVMGTNKVVTVKATSNTTVIANFADNVKPTVTILTPAANSKVSNAVCIVSGKATDNKAVAVVKVKLNSDDWVDAFGTNNWSLSVTLAAGTNTIRAYSMDAANNCSATSSVVCTYVVVPDLGLSILTPSEGAILTNTSPFFLRAGVTNLTATVSSVKFYANGVFVGDGRRSPHGEWAFADGAHLSVMGFDDVEMMDYHSADTNDPFFMMDGKFTTPTNFVGKFTYYVDTNTFTGAVSARHSLNAAGKLTTVMTGDLPLGSRTLSNGTNESDTISYGFLWTNAPASNYTITVRAVYNGVSVTSAPVNITVVGVSTSPVPYTYTTNSDNTINITGYTGAGGAVSILGTISGKTVTSIETSAFYHCTSLTSVTIPDSITRMGDGAFQSCYSLTNVIIGTGVTNIGVKLFWGCGELTGITIPSNVVSIGDDAFLGCSSMTDIVIPDSVIRIGSGAFHSCSSLTGVTIPSAITYIRPGTFYSCVSLTSITIPSSVTSIGFDAFNGCAGLTSITIPDNVTIMAHYAFSGCTGLTNAVVGSGITDLTDHTFFDCTGLIKVMIGAGVATIGDSAFQNCSSLASVYFKGSAPEPGGLDVFTGADVATVYINSPSTSWPVVPPASWLGRPTALWTGTLSMPLSAEKVMADLTPQAAHVADNSGTDRVNVPRATFSYPVAGSLIMTQEVAVALSGNNITLLLTGCPFTTSDTVLVYFKLCLSYGDAANHHTVDLWTSGSVLYGMVDGQVITGLEAVLLNGVLEVKIPVEQAPSQVTIEEVGGGMYLGGGTMTELFRLTPSPALTP